MKSGDRGFSIASGSTGLSLTGTVTKTS